MGKWERKRNGGKESPNERRKKKIHLKMGGGGWLGVVVWVGGNRKRKKERSQKLTMLPADQTLQLCNDHLYDIYIYLFFILLFFIFILTSMKTTENDKDYHSCINTKQTSNNPNHYFIASWQQENSTTTYITQQPLSLS